MSIVRQPARHVKPTRRTARPATTFGAGLIRFIPDAGRQPFTAADLEWAAQTFADGPEMDWDFLAAESAGYDAVTAGCYA